MTYEINFPLLYGVVGVAVCTAAFVSLWTWAAGSERFRVYRLRTPVVGSLAETGKKKRIATIILFDVLLYTAYLTLAYDWLIKDASDAFLIVIGQVFAVLLIYDLMFYWVHRLFHLPFLMRQVHAVHHRVRFPKAVDDFDLHPVDSLWVTTLFFLSIAIVGPLSPTAFVVTLFVYVFINITLHSGLHLPHPCFKLTNYWARKHDVHHGKNPSSNFGSIFPFWDAMFGTNVRV